MQEAVLAMLVKAPSHGYELQARLREVLGPAMPALNAGQIYVTLGRLERAGLVTVTGVSQDEGPERKIYELTPDGHERVTTWMDAVAWPRPALGEFHLKLALADSTRLADPVEIVSRHRREVLQRLRRAQRTQLDEPAGTPAHVLIEGLVLRLEAELRWLDTCAEYWERTADEAKGHDE